MTEMKDYIEILIDQDIEGGKEFLNKVVEYARHLAKDNDRIYGSLEVRRGIKNDFW